MCRPLCKIPDHSILLCSVTISDLQISNSKQNVNSCDTPLKCHETPIDNKRFDYNTLPNNFLDTDLLNETIHIIESQTLEQTDIDQIYEDICNIYYTELNDKVRFKCILNKNKKRYRHSPKEWWNDDLENLWNELCVSEKDYLKYQGPKRVKIEKRSVYLMKQRDFDKAVKKTKRKYTTQKHTEIEELQTSDPRKFWDHLNNLDPKSKKTIPVEVYDDTGNIINDPEDVLNKWESEFKSLFDRLKAAFSQCRFEAPVHPGSVIRDKP